MGQRYISASAAIELIQGFASADTQPARLILYTRAQAGLVMTRADAFVDGQTRHERYSIPAAFWSAVRREPPVPDSNVDDFTARLQNGENCHAFGVAFELDGVLAMLPSNQRAAASRSLSVVSNRAWVNPMVALSEMHASIGPRADLRALLVDQCRTGFVSARAVIVESRRKSGYAVWQEYGRKWDVPTAFWIGLTDRNLPDWERGRFYSDHYNWNEVRLRTLGMHFFRDDLAAVFGLSSDKPDSAPTVAAPKGKGGAPGLPFWDDLWCSIWGRIYRGEFMPKSKADVARAMQEFAERHDHFADISTFKPRARLLYTEYEREGENPDVS